MEKLIRDTRTDILKTSEILLLKTEDQLFKLAEIGAFHNLVGGLRKLVSEINEGKDLDGGKMKLVKATFRMLMGTVAQLQVMLNGAKSQGHHHVYTEATKKAQASALVKIEREMTRLHGLFQKMEQDLDAGKISSFSSKLNSLDALFVDGAKKDNETLKDITSADKGIGSIVESEKKTVKKRSKGLSKFRRWVIAAISVATVATGCAGSIRNVHVGMGSRQGMELSMDWVSRFQRGEKAWKDANGVWWAVGRSKSSSLTMARTIASANARAALASKLTTNPSYRSKSSARSYRSKGRTVTVRTKLTSNVLTGVRVVQYKKVGKFTYTLVTNG